MIALLGFVFFLSIGSKIIDIFETVKYQKATQAKATGAISIITAFVFLVDAVFCARSVFNITIK